MPDGTGTRFCKPCAEDAYESGLFSDEPPRRGRLESCAIAAGESLGDDDYHGYE
jgi:hypothetical protein